MKPNKVLYIVGGACAAGALLCLVLYFVLAPAPGKVDFKLYHKDTLMTIAYKAYGNPEAASGKYWLAKLVLSNSGGSPIEDVSVSFAIPGQIDWTTPDSVPAILPGQTVVHAWYPKLPSRVSEFRTRTPATLEMKLTYTLDGEEQEKIEKREFEFRGVTEIEYTSLPASEVANWYDLFDNYEICAAYVTDEDEVVKGYLGKISETMGGIPVISDMQSLDKLLKSIYEFQTATGMTYAAAKGFPEQIGDTRAIVQSIRLPRDVIYQNSGLCIELALLMNSLCEAAGAKSYLVLIPGHAYTLAQAMDGSMIAIECTGLGGANLGGTASYEQAKQIGAKQIQEVFSGQVPSIIVDIQAEQANGIRPPELSKTAESEIAKMLEERVKKALAANQNANNNNNNVDPNQPDVRPQPDDNDGPGPGQGNFLTFRDPTGVVTLPYPGNWFVNRAAINQLQQMAPWYMFNATDMQSQVAVDLYVFNSNDPAACMAQISNFCGAMGMQYNYQQQGAAQVGGRRAVLYNAAIMTQMGAQVGQVYMIPVGGRCYGVAFGGPTNAFPQYVQTYQTILSNIRIGN